MVFFIIPVFTESKKKKTKPLVQGYIVSELWRLKIQTLYIWFQDCLCSFHGTILLSSRAEGHMISNFQWCLMPSIESSRTSKTYPGGERSEYWLCAAEMISREQEEILGGVGHVSQVHIHLKIHWAVHKICALCCLLIIPQNVSNNKFVLCFYRARKLISAFSQCLFIFFLINSLLILDTYFSPE